MKLLLIFIFCFLVGCSVENSKLKLSSSTENKVEELSNYSYENETCSSDCIPRSMNSPYYKIPLTEKSNINKLLVIDFINQLKSRSVVATEDLKEVNFDDNINPIIFNLNNSILTINPDQSTNQVKSIEYMFTNCLDPSDHSKEIIQLLLVETGFDNNFYGLFNLRKKSSDIMVERVNNSGNLYEISCDPTNGLGGFFIYKD